MNLTGHQLRNALLPGYRLRSLVAPGARLASLLFKEQCHEPAGSPEDGQFCGGSGSKEKQPGIKAQIHVLLATGQAYSVKELAAATGAREDQVRTSLAHLQNPKMTVTGKPQLVLQRTGDRYQVVGTKPALTPDERAALKGTKTEQAKIGTNEINAGSFSSDPNAWGKFEQDNAKLNTLIQEDHKGNASELKAKVSEELGKRLVEHADWQKVVANTIGMTSAGLASRIIAGWASTSGDNDDRARAMQLAARDEFHIQNAKLGHLGMKDSIAEDKAWNNAATYFGFKEVTGKQQWMANRSVSPEDLATFKSGMRAYVRAEYENTQAWFASKGITEVSVFRGMKNSVDPAPTVKTFQGQPLSSFTSNLSTSDTFGKTKYMATFPVSHVVSTTHTGRGCLHEREIVVLGHPITTVRAGRSNFSSYNRGSIDRVGSQAFDNKSKKGQQLLTLLKTDDVDLGDEDLDNADWPKRTWDLPPYKSEEFNANVFDLVAFRRLPVYKYAVATGLIVNDEWVGSPGKRLVARLRKGNEDQPRDEHGRWSSGGGSDVPSPEDQQRAIGGIKDYLGMVAGLQPPPPGFATSPAALLLEYGQPFIVDAKSFEGPRGEMHGCFKNAALAAIGDRNLTYVEGYVAVHGVPLNHAWNVDAGGNVKDPTISPTKGLGYFGIPLSTSYLEQRLVAQKVYGILPFHSNKDLYKNGLPPGAKVNVPVRKIAKYSEDQERDEHGRWTSGGGGLPPTTDPAARGPAMYAKVEAALKAGQDTESLHDKIEGQVGRYNAVREAQHHEIVQAAMEKAVAAGAEKGGKAIVMGGIYGAGKTTALKSLVDSSKYVTISPDDMKEALAHRGMVEPPAGVHPLEASSLIHEESAKLAWDLAEHASSKGYNIIWDTSMGSSGAIDKRLSAMKELHPGYKTTGVFVDVPIEQSHSGAMSRYGSGLARDPTTARYVPPAAINASRDPSGQHSSLNRAAFESRKGNFDRWVLVDNAGYANRVAATSHPDILGPNGKL